MAHKMIRLVMLLIALSQIAATCQGTETGNPGTTGETPPISYTNGQFGVGTAYGSGWSSSERGGVNASAGGSPSSTGGTPSPIPDTIINYSLSPSTTFTDGISSVTLYYVSLTSSPTDLLSFLQGTFPGRSFIPYSGTNLSGYVYDSPEVGQNGGEKQEYYFLQGSILLYVTTDMFTINNGLRNTQTIINSLNFE